MDSWASLAVMVTSHYHCFRNPQNASRLLFTLSLPPIKCDGKVSRWLDPMDRKRRIRVSDAVHPSTHPSKPHWPFPHKAMHASLAFPQIPHSSPSISPRPSDPCQAVEPRPAWILKKKREKSGQRKRSKPAKYIRRKIPFPSTKTPRF